MKILHIDTGRQMHGGQYQALRLHRGLITRGHESVLLAAEGSPLLGQGAEKLSLTRLPGMQRRFDIIHAHDARSHTLCALVSRTPFVVARRVAYPVQQSIGSRWKYRQPTLFIAVSQFVKQQLLKAGVEDRRIEVIYDGVPVPDEPSTGEGILVYQKDVSIAQAAARRAGVSVRTVDHFSQDMNEAKALVYLSQSEGLASGILLGMAHGLAIIASNVGGIPEIVTDGVTGILIPNTEEALAAAFGRLDPRMGKAGRETVRVRYTVDRMVQSTLQAYTKVLGRG
jgi:glycosyltransferase involved in cell wall biosynthesis